MRILFYAPFKPLGHANPSGDLAIAASICGFLKQQGHEVRHAGGPRMRWIYWKPWVWPRVAAALYRERRAFQRQPADLWLTYHTYYKAPDVLGPPLCRRMGIPYVIFQGIFSTKRRRRIRTLPGYLLNRRALLSARHLFTNRLEDWLNLKRLIADDRLSYIRPGICPRAFAFDAEARETLRREWGVGDAPVVLSAAMFRPGVKSRGIAWVIRACGRLARRGVPLFLAIVGDGTDRDLLRMLAQKHLDGRVRFVGKIPREGMHRFYSAGDVFAFPGIRESLGMVYLESQSCGLPVVAFHNGGIPEVVSDGETGVLTPPFDAEAFDGALAGLILDAGMRGRMGAAARRFIRRRHDVDRNYVLMEDILMRIARGQRR